MITTALSIVSFWAGVALSAKIKAGFSALFTKAEAAAKAEEAAVVADVKAKV